MKSITHFIAQKLKLKVNEAKSAVARPQERKFLGFSFTEGPEIQRAIAPKSLERFKKRIREITRRAKGVDMKTIMAELASYMRGWRGYYRLLRDPSGAALPNPLGSVAASGRFVAAVENTSRRRAELMARGVPELAAIPLAAAKAPGVLPEPGLCSSGFPMLTSNRSGSHPWSRSDGLTSRTAVVRTRMPGGVGGAEPRGFPLSRSLTRFGTRDRDAVIARAPCARIGNVLVPGADKKSRSPRIFIRSDRLPALGSWRNGDSADR